MASVSRWEELSHRTIPVMGCTRVICETRGLGRSSPGGDSGELAGNGLVESRAPANIQRGRGLAEAAREIMGARGLAWKEEAGQARRSSWPGFRLAAKGMSTG